MADAAVIPIPDQEAGEVPKAFVVLKAGQQVLIQTQKEAQESQATVEDILNLVHEKMAPYKKIRGGIEFIDAIPKSASGKILRRILKDKEKAAKK